MSLLGSVKFKSTINSALTVLAVLTFVACGNSDNNLTPHLVSSPFQSPSHRTLQENQHQEDGRQQVGLEGRQQPEGTHRPDLISQEQAFISLELASLREPKYLALTIEEYTAGVAVPLTDHSTLVLAGGDGSIENPGITPVGCIKLTINDADLIEDVSILQVFEEMAAEYLPRSEWYSDMSSEERIPNTITRALSTARMSSAERHSSLYGSCGQGEVSNMGYSCLIPALEPWMNSDEDSNWWRIDSRLTGILYFNELFSADVNAMRFICADQFSGQLFHNRVRIQ